LKRLATDKHSSLLALFVSDEEIDKKVLNICTSWLSLSMQVKHFFGREGKTREFGNVESQGLVFVVTG